MKLYYTDPLKAAYMAREFGIELLDYRCISYPEILTWENVIEEMINSYTGGVDLKYIPEKYYIHPDSYGIFDVKFGDLTDAKWEVSSGGEEGATRYIQTIKEGRTTFEPQKPSPVEIIQRDGKAFFEPERE